MKTIKQLTTAFLMLIAFSVAAQQGINYKAIVKDGSGNIIANDLIAVQFIIYKGAALTANVYQETHTPTTDANGIIIVNIGEGISGNVFADIDWGSDEHFLNVQIDTGGGLTDMGTTQFMAVPYALYAESVKTCDLAIGDSYAGGIIFYLDSTGCHGLVCAPTDQAIDVAAVGSQYPYLIHNGIGMGFINTEYSVNLGGDGIYATKLCYDLSLGGFDDWYLPSKYELDLMQRNIGGAASSPNTNIGNFSTFEFEPGLYASRIYWSSTSDDENYRENGLFWTNQLNHSQLDYSSDAWNYTYGKAVRAIRVF